MSETLFIYITVHIVCICYIVHMSKTKLNLFKGAVIERWCINKRYDEVIIESMFFLRKVWSD